MVVGHLRHMGFEQRLGAPDLYSLKRLGERGNLV